MPEHGGDGSGARASAAPAEPSGNAARFEKRLKQQRATYVANGYSHDDGRDPQPKRMCDVVAKSVPDIGWIVRDYIPRRTVTLFTGDGGVGKSLMLQQLMSCVAAGKDWLGNPVERGRCFGVFCEDEESILHHRQLGICGALGIEGAKLSDMLFMDRAGEDSVMFGPAVDNPHEMDFTDFFYRFRRILRAVRPILVGIDTAADTFAGNENNRAQVRNFIRELRQTSYDHDAAVVLCAHPSLSGISDGRGFSGSTAWNNSVRSRLYLTKPEDDEDDVRVVKAMKANYGPIAGEIRCKYDNGAFVRAEVETIGTVARIERSVREKAILQLVRERAEANRHLSKHQRAAERYLPTIAARELDGMNAGLARKIMMDLLMDGAIEEIISKDTSKRSGLIVAATGGVTC